MSRRPELQSLCLVLAPPRPTLLQRQLVMLVCALAALWYLAAVRAQSAVFYADDLQVKAASTQVSPGYLTLIEFFQDVDQISSGRPDLLHVEAVGAKIYVSALARSGSTDLVIEVGARTQLLHVQIAPGNNTHRYQILLDKPAPRVVKPAVKVLAPRSVVKKLPAKVVPAQPVRVINPPSTPAARTVTPVVPAAPVATAQTWTTAPQPAWLSFRVIERDLDRQPNEVTVFFALENSGTVPLLVIDSADLRATQNGVPVPVRPRQGSNPAILRADRTLQGTLTLQLSPAMRRGGPITLSWMVRDPVRQTGYLVEKRLDQLSLD